MKTLLIFCLSALTGIATATEPRAPLPTYTQEWDCSSGFCVPVNRPFANVVNVVNSRPLARAIRRSLPSYSFSPVAAYAAPSYGSAGSFTSPPAVSYGSVGTGVTASQSFFTYSAPQEQVWYGVTYAEPQSGLVLANGDVMTRSAWRAQRRQDWARRPGLFGWRWNVANRCR